jgi:anti-sigma B factor antagonist
MLVVVGEIDLLTAPMLERVIEAAEPRAPRRLTVDFARVSFVDVSGLRVLLEAARRANVAGRELVIERPTENVKRLLDLTASASRSRSPALPYERQRNQ